MREILFRGKRKDNGEWVYGFYSQFHNRPMDNKPNSHQIFELIDEGVRLLGTSIGGFWRIVDPETVGQYTGLTDKNGKKIFEGDIVKDEYSKGQYQYFKVIYNERTYRWEIENKYGMLGQLCNVFGECEVIGNIQDNPELLEAGADNG